MEEPIDLVSLRKSIDSVVVVSASDSEREPIREGSPIFNAVRGSRTIFRGRQAEVVVTT